MQTIFFKEGTVLEALARSPEARVGLLCNQVCFLPEKGAYLFQLIEGLRRLFIPEHGLFSELQDQVALDDSGVYGDFSSRAELVSLYGSSEQTLVPADEQLMDLDILVVDLQDVGARYYTFATTLAYIFRKLAALKHRLKLYLVDRPNPAGRQVEGSCLLPEYESFVGFPGLPHRHGLRLSELANFYNHETEARLEIHIFQAGSTFIPPSPNFPGIHTALVYSGQCLLEGTNLSEGRGTTRPFEFFGAPFLKVFSGNFPGAPNCVLRPLVFQPAFHKFMGENCQGFQIIPQAEYHSLLHTLRLLQYIQGNYAGFSWMEGVYEFISSRPAIEILAGDARLLLYLEGSLSEKELVDYLSDSEQSWINRARDLLLYPESLTPGKLL